jgi:hypothetical protein
MTTVNINALLNFVEVRETLPPSLRIKDDENLYLIVRADYNMCPTADLEKQANGVIFEKNTNKIVCMAQPSIIDVSNIDVIGKALEDSAACIEACEDGTVIRLYHYNGKWRTATTRCIDGSQSRWSSQKSFDEMFWEIFGHDFLDTLDSNYTYIFIMLHSENTIVVHHAKNELVLLDKVHNETLCEDTCEKLLAHPNVRAPINVRDAMHNLQAVEAGCVGLQNVRGIVVRMKEKNSWVSFKYDFPLYSRVKQVRGNTPCVRNRILELLKDPKSLQCLEEHYPEYRMLVALARHSLANTVKTIHKLYVVSHIKHLIQVGEDNIYHRTLKQLHAQYKNTKTPITYNDVMVKVSNLDTHVLKSFFGWV